ncbi:MAG: arginine--tRNA ligase [Spirochaetota bacterium]
MEAQETLREVVLSHLQTGVSKYLSLQGLDLQLHQWKIRIEYSRNESFGDYSTSFILENKKHLPGNPESIAKDLIVCLQDDKVFSHITFTKPGFINFRVAYTYLVQYIQETVFSENRQELYPQVADPQKIVFEFVSANPTGPLNIVSARAAATGDCICSLLQKVGYKVQREFYVNDYGNQVSLLGLSALARLREHLGEELLFAEKDSEVFTEIDVQKNILPAEGYRGEYLSAVVESIYQKHKDLLEPLLKKQQYSDLAEKLSLYVVEENLAKQRKDLEAFGVEFDVFFRESKLHKSESVFSVLEKLQESGHVKQEEGKEVFLSTRFGDDKDRVVRRADGRPTYLLADIAYHQDKMLRGFDRMINIWGPDHHGYIARLQGAVQALGYKKEQFQVIISQQVNLLAKGEKLKMSKRLGQFQTMEDLLTYLGESAKDVGRYFFIMRTLEAPLDFDLELAKDHSDKNPVFYLQYAHARICSIFREIELEVSLDAVRHLEVSEERERLAFWIARFPEEVLDAAKHMEPHRFINYLHGFSKAFTKFYMAKNNRMKSQAGDVRKGLAYLAEASRVVLQEGLLLLGISAPERLEKE